MKESEALTKWCPMARITTVEHPQQQGQLAISIGGGNNRDATAEIIPRACLCIGSKCMMWKPTTTPEQSIVKYYDLTDTKFPPPDGDGWNRKSEFPIKTTVFDGVKMRHEEKWSLYWVRDNPESDGYCGLAR